LNDISNRYDNVNIDEYVIMPNHIHGIIIIKNSVGNGCDRSLQIKSLSSLIGAFKTTSSKLIRNENVKEFKWKKSFYDRIIRDNNELNRIRKYIQDNPANWAQDENNINKNT
jgi:putative transposase